MVLNLLYTRGRMYGYEITQSLSEQTNGNINLTFAALYPVLHKLEAGGMVKTESENVNNRIRKYYTLSNKGKVEAKRKIEEFREYLKIMDSIFNS